MEVTAPSRPPTPVSAGPGGRGSCVTRPHVIPPVPMVGSVSGRMCAHVSPGTQDLDVRRQHVTPRVSTGASVLSPSPAAARLDTRADSAKNAQDHRAAQTRAYQGLGQPAC